MATNLELDQINMHITYQRFGVWSGIAFFFLFWIAMVMMMGFVPPPSPLLNGQEIMVRYQEHQFGARLGIMVAFAAALCLVPWSATISLQMARIEGRYPMMAIVAFGAAIANAVAFYLPFVFWAVALYRVDRAPELVQLISDMAWLEFVMLFSPFVLQTVAIAVVGFSDKSATPTFPRWFCFMSLWIALLVSPGVIAIFFFKGPFAWNGLIGFWVPVAVFCLYFAAMVPLLFKAIRQQELEEQGVAA